MMGEPSAALGRKYVEGDRVVCERKGKRVLYAGKVSRACPGDDASYSILYDDGSVEENVSPMRMWPVPDLPLIIVPGLMSSGLVVEKSSTAPKWEGERIWLNLPRLGLSSYMKCGVWEDPEDQTLKNKWLDHLMLKDAPDVETEGIRVRPVKGLEGIGYLDPDSLKGLVRHPTYVFGPVLEALKKVGYAEGDFLHAANYDWRVAPGVMHTRDNYFEELADQIEKMDKGAGVAILGHSMGNKIVSYFLRYANVNRGQAWLDRYVHSWISAGAVHLGSPSAARSMLFGDAMGLEAFLKNKEAVIMGRSFSSSLSLFPLGAHAASTFYLRRGGVLEIRNFRAHLQGCGFESVKNAVSLTVKVSWSDSDTASLSTGSSESFDDYEALFNDSENLLHFGGPVSIPADATITIVAKETGLHVDRHARKREFLKRTGAAVTMLGHFAHDTCKEGWKAKGAVRASSAAMNLTECLRGSIGGIDDFVERGQRDGFVDVRLPLEPHTHHHTHHQQAKQGRVEFQARWRDFRALRVNLPGSQQLAQETLDCRSGAPICHRDRHEEIYDEVDIPQLMQMEGCEESLQVWEKFYKGDPFFDVAGVDDAPPIRRVIAMHGVNIPTEVMYAVRLNTVRLKGRPGRTRFILDDEADLVESDESRNISGGIIYETAIPEEKKSGDGTVPLHSLEHCRSWASQLDLQVIEFEGVEHRPMLLEPEFHFALIRALTKCSGNEGDKVFHRRSVHAGGWTVATEEGPKNVQFYTYESEEEAYCQFDNFFLGITTRILFDPSHTEVKCEGWNKLAYATIRRAFRDEVSKCSGRVLIKDDLSPQAVGSTFWTIATQDSRDNIQFHTYDVEEDALEDFKHFDRFGKTPRMLFNPQREAVKRAGWKPAAYAGIAHAFYNRSTS